VPSVLDLTPAVAGRTAEDLPLDDVAELVRGHVDPETDIHASAEYRRVLVDALTGRALAAAASAPDPAAPAAEGAA